MGSITTAFCTSAKSEFFNGAFNFGATVTPTATANTSVTLTSVSSNSGIVVGAPITGNVIPANTVVASIDSATQLTLSKAATGSTGFTATVAGDTLKITLIKAGPTGVYGAASVNYTDITGNSDEASGAGYSAGGVVLTNVSPVVSGTGAYVNFSPNPSWTSASFTTDGCMIYNSSVRLGGTSGTNTIGGGRAIGVFSFSGTQTVSSGTFTVLMPSAAIGTAVFRLT